MKNENLQIWNQKDVIWIFLGENVKKNIVIFEISIFEFVKNEILAHTVNFGREFAFSRSPGSQSAL